MKKIGNTFSKGIKIGVLSAAVAMGAAGCKANVDEPGYEYVEETPLESYYFARHRFASENTVNEVVGQDLDQKEKIAWANKHYDEIKEYMLPKVEDLMRKVATENDGVNFLHRACQEVFTYSDGTYGNPGFNTGSLDSDISRSNYSFSRILGAIGAKFTTAVANQENRNEGYESDYENFKALYSALALRSYNDSLGNMQNDTTFPFNQERDSIETAVANNQGSAAYTANAQDLRNVEDTLKKALTLVANETGVSLQTLTDAVNLSLLNASVYGARDYVESKTGIQPSSRVDIVRGPDSSLEKLTVQKYGSPMYSGYSQQLTKDLQEQQMQQENSR